MDRGLIRMKSNITLQFRGTEYRIPAEKAFEIGERIEDIVTLSELASWGTNPRFHKIARVYGEMLRFAGCKITNAEVHTDMMAQIKEAGANGGELLVAQAIAGFIAVLMDGAPEGGDDDGKKANAS